MSMSMSMGRAELGMYVDRGWILYPNAGLDSHTLRERRVRKCGKGGGGEGGG